MNSKLQFRNTLQLRNTSKPVFIPFVYGLAARISQIPLRDMVQNPTYFANSLEAAYKLFKYDGIPNSFDSSIESEACGCQVTWVGEYEAPIVTGSCDLNQSRPDELIKNSRIPILTEVTKRLGISIGKEVAIIGVITGPLSLTKSMITQFDEMPDFDTQHPEILKALSVSSDLLTRLVKGLGESRIDAMFIREEQGGTNLLNKLTLFKDIYATLFNIIRFYDSYPLLVVRDLKLENIPDLYNLLRPSGLILFGIKFTEEDLLCLKKLSDSLNICFGLPIPLGDQDILWGQLNLFNDFMIKSKARGLFYTSEGEVPYNIPIETLRSVVGKILTDFK